MATLIRNQVRYFVKDQDCIGRACLDLGPATLDDKGIDIRCRMRSACRRMLQKGCPGELPGYDTRIASKHMLEGISVFHEPIPTRILPVPCLDVTTYTPRDAKKSTGRSGSHKASTLIPADMSSLPIRKTRRRNTASRSATGRPARRLLRWISALRTRPMPSRSTTRRNSKISMNSQINLP